MSNGWDEVAANAVAHAAQMAQQEVMFTAGQHARPSVLYRPRLAADGTMWCASLGDDLQVGICGFGETPAKAMEAFDFAFNTSPTPAAMLAARAKGWDDER